jgi:membrane-associated phospholipid phosphatase
MNTWLEWGIPIIEWFQHLGDGWLLPMEFFSFLGTEYFIMLVMPVLYWCYDISLGFRLGLILIFSNGINSILKMAFGWPRPYWVSDSVKALSTESSFGIPSGHSQNAVVLWGRLAFALRRPMITFICIVLIFLISLSRLYLGVHFPTDVLGGWLIGCFLVFIFMVLDKPVGQWLKNQSFRLKMILAFIFPVSIMILGIVVIGITADRPVPQDWIETAQIASPEGKGIDPYNLEGFISGSGSLFGFSAGYLLLLRWNRFKTAGPLLKRINRYIVGICGVVVIFFGLRMIFPQGETLLAHSLRFIRYAGVGLWVSYLGPRAFVALRLA